VPRDPTLIAITFVPSPLSKIDRQAGVAVGDAIQPTLPSAYICSIQRDESAFLSRLITINYANLSHRCQRLFDCFLKRTLAYVNEQMPKNTKTVPYSRGAPVDPPDRETSRPAWKHPALHAGHWRPEESRAASTRIKSAATACGLIVSRIENRYKRVRYYFCSSNNREHGGSPAGARPGVATASSGWGMGCRRVSRGSTTR
jgi:hypothetical protein